jgi:hypothetical protein
MPPLNKAYSSTSNKQGISVIVFIMKGTIPFIWRVGESAVEWCRQHALPLPWTGKKKVSSLNAEEMSYAIEAFHQHCQEHDIPVTGVVMDRARWHTATKVKTKMDSLGLERILLPPRSHELSVLDNGFFGQVDTTWDRWLEDNKGPMSWLSKKNKLLKIIRETSTTPFVESWEKNLRKCEEKGGLRWMR